MKKVVITGVGCICSIGKNMKELTSSLKAGRCGVKTIKRFDVSMVPDKLAYLIDDFKNETIPTDWLEKTETLEREEYSFLFALKATAEAIENSRIDLTTVEHKRLSVSVGSSLAGDTFTERYIQNDSQLKTNNNPELLNYTVRNLQSFIARIIDARGPAFCVSTACASSSNSIGIGFDLIRTGLVDVVVAGGTDCYARLVHAGFNSLKALSVDQCRPFSVKRNGTILGEGAAMFILESEEHARKRGANIIAELAGYAISNDAYHVTAPSPDGFGAISVMKGAMKSGNIDKSEVSYINAHGTGTITNDGIEAKAIKNLFEGHLDHIYVNSTKAHHGHTLAAAGAIEAAATLIQMNEGFIVPVLGIRREDSIEPELKIVTDAIITTDINVALSNSFGFGGNNSCLAFRKYGTN